MSSIDVSGVGAQHPSRSPSKLGFVFDLDGTLIDSVYQHVLAWQEALEQAGIELSAWRIHRRLGMSWQATTSGTSWRRAEPEPWVWVCFRVGMAKTS